MHAIHVYHAGHQSTMKMESNVEIPHISDEQVLVRVKAVGVNLHEVHARKGEFGPKEHHAPGLDAAGLVEKVGDHVKHFHIGDRVFVAFGETDGAYTEFMAVHTHQVFHLPDHVTFEQGAAMGTPYFTAHRGVINIAHVIAGQTVLVHGASDGVGHACMEIAKHLGAVVIGTASTPEDLMQVEKHGSAFNHHEDDYAEKIARHFPHIDVIFEMDAEHHLHKDIHLIAEHGLIVMMNHHGNMEATDLHHLMHKEAKLTGVNLHRISKEEMMACGEFLVNGLRDGSLLPHVSHTMPLAEADKAHQLVEASQEAFGKVVLLL